MLRVFLNITLLVAVLYVPLLALIVGAVLAARYRAFELLAWGLFFDALYATPVAALFHFQYLGTLSAVCVLVAASFLKQRLVWYPHAP